MSLLVDIEKRLDTFTLRVQPSRLSTGRLALLGASGCGKSVTLKCIAGIDDARPRPHRSRRRDAL